MRHEPTPFGDELGGGVRCSCGEWEERTNRSRTPANRRTMRDVWAHYRAHWEEHQPPLPPTPPDDLVLNVPLFPDERTHHER